MVLEEEQDAAEEGINRRKECGGTKKRKIMNVMTRLSTEMIGVGRDHLDKKMRNMHAHNRNMAEMESVPEGAAEIEKEEVEETIKEAAEVAMAVIETVAILQKRRIMIIGDLHSMKEKMM